MPEPTRGAHPRQPTSSFPSQPPRPQRFPTLLPAPALPASQPQRYSPLCPAAQPGATRPSPAAHRRQRGRAPGAAAMLTEPLLGRKGKRDLCARRSRGSGGGAGSGPGSEGVFAMPEGPGRRRCGSCGCTDCHLPSGEALV